MSGQEYCYSEQKAASRLLSHLRRAQGQLSWDSSGHGRGESLPEEMVKAEKTRRLPADRASEPQEPLSPSPEPREPGGALTSTPESWEPGGALYLTSESETTGKEDPDFRSTQPVLLREGTGTGVTRAQQDRAAACDTSSKPCVSVRWGAPERPLVSEVPAPVQTKIRAVMETQRIFGARTTHL